MLYKSITSLLAIALLTTSPAVAEEKPIKLGNNTNGVTKLLLQPSSLIIQNARDARQFLVIGIKKDGSKVDLTNIAKLTTKSKNIQIAADRYINPIAPGKANITVSAVNLKANLPVKVLSTEHPPVRFTRDVQAVLSKAGCNAGTCHGSQKGKNGFRLSLRGYDPEYDYQVLVHDLLGRRVNRVHPAQSLMLLKGTGAIPHEGKQLFKKDSRYYNIVHQWIKEGSKYEPSPATARPTKLSVLPTQVNLDKPGNTQQIIVLAHFPDNTTRDITRDAVLSSNNGEVAKVENGKVIAIRRGEAAILIRYEGSYGVTSIRVMGNRSGFAWKPMKENNLIDKHINNKLKAVKILPSDPCTDAEFVRRAYLDIVGLPPTAAQARAFVEDKTPSKTKRDKLINKLVGSPDFVAFWSNKWADLLQCNEKTLGKKGVWVFREWIRQAIAKNTPYDKFVYNIITAQGSNYVNPASNYFRSLRDNGKITEDVSQTFLGVRFNCNKCHDHPFERWTQEQYYQFGAFFARIKYKKGKRPDEEIIYSAASGEVKHPKTGMTVSPKTPYGKAATAQIALRRHAFAKWMTSKDNPLFAKSFVNRIWSYMLGRGIIDPVDDIRASNPPINPPLLDALTNDFIDSGFNFQHLIKRIASSRTYQASVASNRWNADDSINFARYYPKRLSAEQLLDAIARATGTQPRVQGLPASLRSVYAPSGMVNGNNFLTLFGRPKRESACECERSNDVSLAHALNLINGPVISGAVIAPNNSIAKIIAKEKDDAKAVTSLYYLILSRPPSATELKLIGNLGKNPNQRLEVAQDLAWALLNSPAFLFNR